MSAPTLAYAFGTTPASGGGRNALAQAIKSMLLGVNTTIASAIASTGVQAATPAAMTNIAAGTPLWINWGLTDQECVSVILIAGASFTANFTKTHSAGATVTCGLPILGVASPWTLATSSLTNIDGTYVSSAPTATADAGFAVVMIGSSSSSQSIGLATADDVDISGANDDPHNPANYSSGSGITSPIIVQDAQFSYWMCCCEFGICVEVLVSGVYITLAAMTLRTPASISQRGVGIATAGIASSDTSITLTTDISSRIAIGQNIMIQNQSHNGGSAHYSQANVVLTVASVSGTGSASTLGFTTTVGANFDSGALVGAVMANGAEGGGTAFDNVSWWLSHNNNGSWSGPTSNQASPDSAVITNDMNNFESPTKDLQVLYAGELDLPLIQNNSSFKGICGFAYCFQEFTQAGVSQQDVFFDGSGPFVWKAFLGNNAASMGPLSNPLNTQTNPTIWVP